jgi:hypothetical protein
VLPYGVNIAPPLAGSALRTGNIDQSNCSNLQIALPLNLGHVIADLRKKVWDVDQSNCSNEHSCVRICNCMLFVVCVDRTPRFRTPSVSARTVAVRGP